jgi:hypothetical protein
MINMNIILSDAAAPKWHGRNRLLSFSIKLSISSKVIAYDNEYLLNASCITKGWADRSFALRRRVLVLQDLILV